MLYDQQPWRVSACFPSGAHGVLGVPDREGLGGWDSAPARLRALPQSQEAVDCEECAGEPGRASEQARGSEEQNKAYCTKEDTRESGPFEFGVYDKDAGKQGNRSDLAEIAMMARRRGLLCKRLLTLIPGLYSLSCWDTGTAPADRAAAARRERRYGYGLVGGLLGPARRTGCWHAGRPATWWTPGGTLGGTTTARLLSVSTNSTVRGGRSNR